MIGHADAGAEAVVDGCGGSAVLRWQRRRRAHRSAVAARARGPPVGEVAAQPPLRRAPRPGTCRPPRFRGEPRGTWRVAPLGVTIPSDETRRWSSASGELEELDALVGATRARRRAGRAHRGPGRHRQDAPRSPRPAPGRGPSGLGRPRRARQRARAGVPVRRRAPALRGARSPTRRRAARARRARRRRRRRCSARRPSPPTARGDGSFAALHGLYWLALNLAAERGRSLLAVDDLHWCDRPSLRFLAYLARPPRGPAGARRGDAAHRRAGRRPGAARRDRARARDARDLRPAPLSAAAVASSSASGSATDADAGVRAACHARDGRQPAAPARAAEARSPPTACRPTPATSTSVARHRPARRLAHGARCGSPGCRRPRRRSRAPWRCSATAPTSPTVAALAGARRAGRGRGHRRARARRDPRRPRRRSASSTRSCATPSTSELAPGERELEHARAAACCSPRAPPRADRRAAARHGPRAASLGRRASCSAAGRAPPRRRAPPTARSPYLRRALEEPAAAGAAARSSCSSSGWPRRSTSGAGAVEHLRAAYDALTDAAARARPPRTGSSRIAVFTGAAEEAAAVARGTARELPAELDDVARGARGDRAGHDAASASREPDMLGGWRLPRRARRRRAPGARMLAALAALGVGVHRRPGATTCAALARGRSPTASCSPPTTASSTVAAIGVAALADRDEAPAPWERLARRRPPRAARCSRSPACTSGAGSRMICARRARRGRGASCRRPRASSRSGAAARSTALLHVARFRAQLGSSAATWPRRARARSAPRTTALDADGAALPWLRGRGRAAARRGPRRGGARRGRRRTSALRRLASEPGVGPVARARAQALDRLGRTDEALARGRGGARARPRAGARPGRVGRALRVLGELERDDGLGDLEEAVDAARRLAGAARAREGARRARRRAAPRAAAGRRPRAAAPRARARRGLRRRRRSAATCAPSCTRPARGRAPPR